MFILKNDHLTAQFSLTGAELQSLIDHHTQQEYCWQGDANYWSGRAPLLFPVVGAMWNGVTRIDQKEYAIPKHGFVRRRTWMCTDQSDTQITFALENLTEDLDIFPWKFRLEVTYTLDERTLRADFRVTNRSEASTMWFQMGGHPSIQLPDWQAEGQEVAGYLRFEGRPLNMLRASTGGCTEPQKVAVPWSDDVETSAALASHHPANAVVPISVSTFEKDALIFDKEQVQAVQVLNLQRQCIARISSSAPVWLVWAPAGKHSPFLCVEPWYGLCDAQGFSGSIQERPYIQHAAPNTTWHGWYALEV